MTRDVFESCYFCAYYIRDDEWCNEPAKENFRNRTETCDSHLPDGETVYTKGEEERREK
jgi:hypothetical protein